MKRAKTSEPIRLIQRPFDVFELAAGKFVGEGDGRVAEDGADAGRLVLLLGGVAGRVLLFREAS
jgi:hypothetical protein